MTTRSLIRVLLVVVFGWLLLLGPGVLVHWSILRAARGYRPAEFLVTGSNCIGGQTTRDSKGNTSTSPRYCFLEGTVLLAGEAKGVPEELSIGSTVPADRPPGTRLRVFYNPGLPSFGINYLNQRTLPAEEGPDPAALAGRFLRSAAWMFALALATVLAIQLVLIWGVRRLSHPPQQLALDLGGGQAALGVLLFSQGLTLLLAQFPDVAWGGVVFGLILAGIGAPLLIRRCVVLSRDDGRLVRARHLFSIVFGRQELPLPPVDKVRLRSDRDGVVVELEGAETTVTLGTLATHPSARKVAENLAAFLGVEVEDRARDVAGAAIAAGDAALATRRRVARRRLWRRLVAASILIDAVIVAVLAVEFVPNVRRSVATSVLKPFGYQRQVGLLRWWALDRLARDSAPEARLELLRALNTIDAGTFPEIAAELDAACSRAVGLTPQAGQDRDATIRAVNEQAVRQLGRSVDENGGVLGLLPVESRFVESINAIADPDPRTGWLAWQGFAAGDLVTPEQFLWAVGPALGDRRPIHFVIAGKAEGQPEPITPRSDLLARTVGEALALRLWMKRGVGDDRFPDDFSAWWKEWAWKHRLPPLPPRN
jgi:hypothetical protein